MSTPRHYKHLPVSVLILITMFWGGSFIVVQTALRWAGPYSFVGMRFLVAGLIALLLCGKEIKELHRREITAGIMIGTILFGGYILQTIGLTSIPSSKSAFLTGLYVPLVPLVQWAIFRKLPKLKAWVGVLVAFIGLILLSNPHGMSLQIGTGEWLSIISTLLIAFEISFISHFAQGCNPKRTASVQLLTVSLLAFVSMAFTHEAPPVFSHYLTACILGVGAATALIIIGMNWAQKTVSATSATVIYAMEPVWAGVIGYLAGEPMTWMSISGAGLIILSVLISSLDFGFLRPRPASSVATDTPA
ncbi:DMT family transporter [Leeia oryzae]|uniref:DMT family transporter n=1 Tax=Leeia oryzae TaxID=356662 RepID=UPI000477656E|nr:DMT family transporter [Leeia oryzae]